MRGIQNSDGRAASLQRELSFNWRVALAAHLTRDVREFVAQRVLDFRPDSRARHGLAIKPAAHTRRDG
jgi:hypothetical protein